VSRDKLTDFTMQMKDWEEKQVLLRGVGVGGGRKNREGEEGEQGGRGGRGQGE
jgi:hypothetical protein